MSLVNVKSGFSRKYLIFANEDAGYEAGRKPSGHVKLEVRGGKGKLHSVIHNMKPGNGTFDYALYFLSVGGRLAGQHKAGAFKMESGKAELECFFDPLNVGRSGCAIERFNVFAVIVEHADKQYPGNQHVRKLTGGIICPLAAYANKRVDWRSIFKALPYEKGASERKPFPAEAALKHILPEQDAADWQGKLPAQDTRTGRREKPQEHQGERREQDTRKEQQDTRKNQADTRLERQDTCQERNDKARRYEKKPEQQDAHPGEHSPGQTQTKPPAGIQPGDKPAYGPNKGDPGCVYLDGSPCSALSDGKEGDSCSSCIFRSGEKPVETQSHGDIIRLKNDLDKCFETSDPFHSKRSDYIWWKVTDPVNLNNILYMNGIRTPLMFSPAVMMSYYRYKHLIIGIFTHRTGQSFIVCGVPGMHMVDGKPFGEMSKWVQADGNKPRYGTFGYWLVYINPDDGKILEL